ncbi:MAG: signal peptidase I [Lachnospiraceae bacterium]|nr:signal peptidase I [Lachnospiraceae bacterium]
MNKTGKNVLNVVVSVILWIVILVAALFAFVTLATKDSTRIASIGGFSPLTVQSDSMKPTFSTGDLLIIKKCNPDTLAEGDIITFHTIIDNQYALNTHRIKEIKEENGIRNYVTQGDNNAIADMHTITGADIVGKYVTKIPFLGKLMNFLASSVGFLLCIVLPLLVFFVYQVYHLIMISVEMKKAAAIEAALEAEEQQNAKRQQAAEAEAAEVDKIKAETQAALDEAEKARKALEEAKRLQAEAEEALARAKAAQEKLEK